MGNNRGITINTQPSIPSLIPVDTAPQLFIIEFHAVHQLSLTFRRIVFIISPCCTHNISNRYCLHFLDISHPQLIPINLKCTPKCQLLVTNISLLSRHCLLCPILILSSVTNMFTRPQCEPTTICLLLWPKVMSPQNSRSRKTRINTILCR